MVSQSRDHLKSGQLGTADVTASTGTVLPRSDCCRDLADRTRGQALDHAVVGLGIIGVWWVSRLITGDTHLMNPVGLYAECSTMATILILFVYFLTMLSCPCSCGAATASRFRLSDMWRSRLSGPSL